MTVFYGEEGFKPDIIDMAIMGRAAYWEFIVSQAQDFFTEKEWFMNWVCAHYFDDGHRFAASACWDIAQLKLSDVAEDEL